MELTFRLLKELVKAGHVSEKHKRAVLNQFVFLYRRLEKLKFEEKDRLENIKKEIDSILMEELTIERIGIEVNKEIYHGSGIANIKSFEVDMEEFDYFGSATLGHGINCTDNKRMAINYAFYRQGTYIKKEDYILKKYGNRVRPTVYTLRLNKGRNYFADLSDPIKLRAIYRDLMKFCYEEGSKKRQWYISAPLEALAEHLRILIKINKMFPDIRALLGHEAALESSIHWINYFIKNRGYHGLRCMEGGEVFESIFKWEPSMSYVIFNPEDVEITAEEHFDIKNGKLTRIK